MKKNVLLIYGGGSTEHEVSLISANYLKSQIDQSQYNLIEIEINHNGQWKNHSDFVQINFEGKLVVNQKEKLDIDLVIPCLHGFPGETGDLQSYLEMLHIPYIGCNSETSKICFNKISTKLWLEAYGIKTTPFLALSNTESSQLKRAKDFFKQYKNTFVKASNQGSSVGCFPLTKESEISDTIMAAFALSPFVIMEQMIDGRELEVSVFEYNEKICVTNPGEIICPDHFYSYDEKYDKTSSTETIIEAKNLNEQQIKEIKQMANDCFKFLKLRHLSRIDFFLTKEGQIYINEVNTFPGLTPISMFPKMMENSGVVFKNFINQTIEKSLKDS